MNLPAATAYSKPPASRGSILWRISRNESNEHPS